VTALKEEISRMIAADGPLTVERYMALCLGHPTYGYYMRQDPFGAGGDFTTAPEISQMFGELIGLWAVAVWDGMGAPKRLRLVELGPGRGTLMADLLRAARIRPEFLDAADVELVETSPAFRERQRRALADKHPRLAWRDRFADVPEGPAVILANEFFDALPTRQFVRTDRDWRERLVGLDAGGALAFGLSEATAPGLVQSGRPGDFLECPRAALELTGEIARRIVAGGGAALIIDYGYVGPAFGDTLQAVHAHAYADPLAEPGGADLTVHVDFAKLADVARAQGGRVHGPISQRDFLLALGIEARAERLKAGATPAQARDIDAALARLTAPGAREMGELFKAMCIAHPHLGISPGFPPEGSTSESDDS
jgi:NADH dehydrogenase [ubiquinone] 1 alpha subcomplex assembly factor 7